MNDESQELVKLEPGEFQPLPENQNQAVMSVIHQVAMNPQADIGKMEALMKMHEHIEDRDAEKAYWAAMPKLQADLPLIPKKGVMKMTKNNKSWDIPFAKFEDVIETIRPLMKKHGFSLTFRHKTLDSGAIQTLGIMAHKQGHVEKDEFTSDPDTTGSKNGLQAIGSARSYGKRYTTDSLLGLAFGGEDDDGKVGGEFSPQPPKVKYYPDESFKVNLSIWKNW
ncbi:ERF family protein, partial [Candidatus Pacearchaeota archaeon]|nr:ERF family protein [Candidatus Pacearchaeota archaeon]